MHQTGQPQTQRTRSLNPLIYPSWWGDEDDDEEPPRHKPVTKTEQPPQRNRSVKNGGEVVVLDSNPAGYRQVSGERRQPPHQNVDFYPAQDTFSLADALQQAKTTAERLDREMNYYKPAYSGEKAETESSIQANNIVDIRDERFYKG